jgi:hypothetical protein
MNRRYRHHPVDDEDPHPAVHEVHAAYGWDDACLAMMHGDMYEWLDTHSGVLTGPGMRARHGGEFSETQSGLRGEAGIRGVVPPYCTGNCSTWYVGGLIVSAIHCKDDRTRTFSEEVTLGG